MPGSAAQRGLMAIGVGGLALAAAPFMIALQPLVTGSPGLVHVVHVNGDRAMVVQVVVVAGAAIAVMTWTRLPRWLLADVALAIGVTAGMAVIAFLVAIVRSDVAAIGLCGVWVALAGCGSMVVGARRLKAGADA